MKAGMVRRFGQGGAVGASAFRTLLLSYSPSLYWPLDAVYGVNDQSVGGTNDGSASGPAVGGHTATAAPIVGEDASCTDFDGTDDKVTSTYNPFTGVRTWLGWAYRDDSTSEDTLFAGTADFPGSLLVRLETGSQEVDLFVGAENDSWAAAWPGNAEWVFWALVFDEPGDAARLYINGAFVSEQTVATAYPGAPGNFQIGVFGAGVNPFNGKMAHVAVVESGLNGTQISNLYAARLG
jgi:hypothetical protein